MQLWQAKKGCLSLGGLNYYAERSSASNPNVQAQNLMQNDSGWQHSDSTKMLMVAFG